LRPARWEREGGRSVCCVCVWFGFLPARCGGGGVECCWRLDVGVTSVVRFWHLGLVGLMKGIKLDVAFRQRLWI
jgi:hypothetical protein